MSLVGAFLIATALGPLSTSDEIVVASKNFTEGRVLGEIVAQLIGAETELDVRHAANLGGTAVCWEALLAGEIDVYVDYTGTAWSVILQEPGAIADPLRTFTHVQQEYRRRYDVETLSPLGLNNTYALALTRERAEALGVTRISDLTDLPSPLAAGFSIEFMNREDGWPGLDAHYSGLDIEPRGMEHGLAYEALDKGELDLVDAYSTDGKLLRYDVVVLEDDLGFFPPYDAVPLMRGATLRAHPELLDVFARLAHSIDDVRAMELNHAVEVGGLSFEQVARDFLTTEGLMGPDATARVLETTPRDQRTVTGVLWSDRARLTELLIRHVWLVAASVGIAAFLSIPLGILAARHAALRTPLLGGAAVLQTIPGLALLAFLISIPWLGLGVASAVVALVVYAVLPILRNTYTGLASVDPTLVDTARGLGMTPTQILVRVQLPIAIRTIVAGLRTAAVISVGVATLAAFIGAGGLGQPIVEGLYLNDTTLVLSGALPAAALALGVDAALGVLERRLTPRGLRATTEDR